MNTHGFTFFEVIVTLLIFSVLVLISIPLIDNVMEKNRTLAAVDNLARSINFMRYEAIIRNTVVEMCPSKNQRTCGGKWSNGWLIKAGSQILRVHDSFKPWGTLTWKSFPSHDYLRMSPSGFTQYQNGTFLYCAQGKTHLAKAVIVNKAGRVRLADKGSRTC